MDFLLPLALGLAIGAAILFLALRNKTVQQDSAPTTSTDLASSVQGVVQSALNEALSALNEQSRRDREESIKLAADRVAEASSERLGKSAKDIDTSLRSVQESLSQRMQQMDVEIKRLHDQNAEKFGNVDRAVNDLVKRTSDLNNVLSSSQARGQWGERMAEDMLRAAGFIEGANYKKQNTIEGGGRPDYTFMMPPDRVLYMDVKFPMDSYTAFVAAVDQTSRDSLKKDFITAVRARVTELQKRDYAVVTTEHSLDYVLLFVPNESITGFIHEADPNLIDWALAQKVVLCSPLNLYAFLVVIRQATESFHTEQAASHMMQLMNKFKVQWEKYVKSLDQVKKSFDKMQGELDVLTVGARYKKLAGEVKKIDDLRKQQNVPELPASELADDEIELQDADEDETD
jgi:DNA recombination protein RmuC